jgi:predicted ABC-type ATPase
MLTGISKGFAFIRSGDFLTSVIYIGLKSEQLAVSRIGLRYSRGGHNVPDEDVIRRYNLSLTNLPKVIKIADRIKIFDNTLLNYKYIGMFKNGQLEHLNNLPLWLESTFYALGLHDKIDNFHKFEQDKPTSKPNRPPTSRPRP